MDSAVDQVKKCIRCGRDMLAGVCLCIYKIPFSCKKCDYVVSDLTYFREHLQNMHTKSKHVSIVRTSVSCQKQINKAAVAQSVDMITEDRIETCAEFKDSFKCDKGQYECNTCKDKFATKLGFLAHNLTHIEKEQTNSYQCHICTREFLSAASLQIHITRMHTQVKKHTCDICNKGFSNLNTLDAHKRLHLGIKPFKCNLCHKSYSQSGNLAYHKNTHVGVKSHVCHLCGKAFMTSSILANHERRHSGLKPFVCDACGRAFADNCALTHHKVVHSGVRSYMCDVCGKAFAHKHTLASHKRIHSGEKRYKCAICERAFTQMSTMLQHKNTHTGEKSYGCVCGKSFTQQSSLARHKRLHEIGVASHPCNLCEKKFSYKSTLYKHKRRAHRLENHVACDVS
ncbi:zinc finger protein 664-like [Bacillus rossius redtenbacheri]|uniref:zinc finger protein 664-like n=1 Tax=Bacillus rossius redtenbacheri TaxID=93214 RepID=UPI002FDE2FE0